MTKLFKKIIVPITVIAMLILSAVPYSAETLLDTDKKVSISVTCSKPGYTFELFQVASLDSNSTSPYKIMYNAFTSEIKNAVNSGDSKDILLQLDNLSTLPDTVISCGIFDSNENSFMTFDNLSQGIYYIKTTGYPAGVKRVENSVIALPYYNGESWIYESAEIELASKVQDDVPTSEKTITNSTKGNINFTDVSLGDKVDFMLKNTTAGSASIKLNTYTVYDDMAAGLTLDKSSFKVYLADKNGRIVENLSKDEYKVNITSEKEGENTLFNVALTEEYLSRDNFYNSNAVYLTVTYSARLNQYAVKGVLGNPNEDTELEYGNSSTIDSVPGNTVYVYTYGVSVIKLDEKRTALEGAKFALYLTEENANAKQNEIATGVSDKNGDVIFYTSDNIPISLSSGNYYIVETEAPEGYNVYGKVIPISIDVTYNEAFINETWIQNAPENGTACCTVTDTKVTLPQTGGYVRYIYFIGGVLILLGSIMYYVSKKAKIK